MNDSNIKNVAVIGSGLIGSSWATLFAMNGLLVSVNDIDDDALNLAKERIRNNLVHLASEEIMSEDDIDNIISRITFTKDIKEAVSKAQFIQENGPDSIGIKESMMKVIEKNVSEDAIYATSTSALLVSDIAKYAKHPERCIGGHPYNPPHLIPLVEISTCEVTDKEIVEKACDFYRSLGKEPVVLKKESMGFIANRLQAALNRELVDMVMRGVCSVEDVDKALTFGPGLRWGILGQTLNAHLGGGERGIKGMIDLTLSSSKAMNSSLANWSDMPDGWGDAAQSGVEEEMKHRAPEQGQTIAEITKYRDHMLIELLKLHGKLNIAEKEEE